MIMKDINRVSLLRQCLVFFVLAGVGLVLAGMTGCSGESAPVTKRKIYDQIYDFGENTLHYHESISADEAKRLGDYLMSQGWDEGEPVIVRLAKTEDSYQFQIVAKQDIVEQRSVLLNSQKMAVYLSQKVFNNARVEIQLCDGDFKPLKVVNSEETP